MEQIGRAKEIEIEIRDIEGRTDDSAESELVSIFGEEVHLFIHARHGSWLCFVRERGKTVERVFPHGVAVSTVCARAHERPCAAPGSEWRKRKKDKCFTGGFMGRESYESSITCSKQNAHIRYLYQLGRRR